MCNLPGAHFMADMTWVLNTSQPLKKCQQRHLFRAGQPSPLATGECSGS